MVAKFGIASMFNIVYIANAHIFPTLFSATALGVCNFAARLATIFAPLTAEIDRTTSMSIFTGLAAVSFFVSLGVKRMNF